MSDLQSCPDDEGLTEHVKLANVINIHRHVQSGNSENCTTVANVLTSCYGLNTDVAKSQDTSFLFCPRCQAAQDTGWLVMSSSPQLIKDCSITDRNNVVAGKLIVAIPLICKQNHKYILCVGDNRTSTRTWLRDLNHEENILSEGSGPLES